MRIAIIGAGALGVTFAAMLAHTGNNVTVVVRERDVEALNRDGLRLTGGFGVVSARVTAVSVLTERQDLILLCTKAHEADRALEAHAEIVDGTELIIVQNGLDSFEIAARHTPNSECFVVLSMFAANLHRTGNVEVTANASSYLGDKSGTITKRSLELSALLSLALPVRAIANIRGAQWSKLVVNMVNALPAILGKSVQDVIDDKQLRKIVTAQMRECARIGIAVKVTFGSIQDLNNMKLRCFARSPIAIGQRIPRQIRHEMGTVPNLGSTLQSIRRGKSTEVDYINGAVVRQAALMGLSAPLNSLITEMVHEVERSAAHYSREEVLRRVAAVTRQNMPRTQI